MALLSITPKEEEDRLFNSTVARPQKRGDHHPTCAVLQNHFSDWQIIFSCHRNVTLRAILMFTIMYIDLQTDVCDEPSMLP
jgi:hypothetical protein